MYYDEMYSPNGALFTLGILLVWLAKILFDAYYSEGIRR